MGRRKDHATALKEEGLAKTDNNLALSSWPQVALLNHKNYYTNYLKRDEQFLAFRTIQEVNTQQLVAEARERDRALSGVDDPSSSKARSGENGEDEDEDEDDASKDDEPHGSTFVVIHPGSQNLRIGFANDAFPKTVPMVIAHRAPESESEVDGGDPLPKRAKIEDGMDEDDVDPELQFGAEVCYSDPLFFACAERGHTNISIIQLLTSTHVPVLYLSSPSIVCRSIQINGCRAQNPHAQQQTTVNAKLPRVGRELEP